MKHIKTHPLNPSLFVLFQHLQAKAPEKIAWLYSKVPSLYPNRHSNACHLQSKPLFKIINIQEKATLTNVFNIFHWIIWIRILSWPPKTHCFSFVRTCRFETTWPWLMHLQHGKSCNSVECVYSPRSILEQRTSTASSNGFCCQLAFKRTVIRNKLLGSCGSCSKNSTTQSSNPNDQSSSNTDAPFSRSSRKIRSIAHEKAHEKQHDPMSCTCSGKPLHRPKGRAYPQPFGHPLWTPMVAKQPLVQRETV